MEKNTTIFLVICIFLGLYLVLNLILQITKTLSRNQKIKKAKKQMLKAIEDKNIAKENLIQELSNHFDSEISKKVSQGNIWSGMPDFLLIIALGKASEIKESFFHGITTEICYYGRYKTRLGNIRYNREVTLENKIVVGWKDLN